MILALKGCACEWVRLLDNRHHVLSSTRTFTPPRSHCSAVLSILKNARVNDQSFYFFSTIVMQPNDISSDRKVITYKTMNYCFSCLSSQHCSSVVISMVIRDQECQKRLGQERIRIALSGRKRINSFLIALLRNILDELKRRRHKLLCIAYGDSVVQGTE